MTSGLLESKLKRYKINCIVEYGLCAILIGILILFVFALKSIFGLTFLIPIVLLFTMASKDLNNYKEIKQELDELYQEAARNFMNSGWQESWYRYKYGEAWYQNYKKEKQAEEERRQQQYQYQRPNNTIRSVDPVREAYKFFGLAYNTGVIEVRRTYRKLALRYHPDHGGNAEKFKLLVQHKDVLFSYLGIK